MLLMAAYFAFCLGMESQETKSPVLTKATAKKRRDICFLFKCSKGERLRYLHAVKEAKSEGRRYYKFNSIRKLIIISF